MVVVVLVVVVVAPSSVVAVVEVEVVLLVLLVPSVLVVSEVELGTELVELVASEVELVLVEVVVVVDGVVLSGAEDVPQPTEVNSKIQTTNPKHITSTNNQILGLFINILFNPNQVWNAESLMKSY